MNISVIVTVLNEAKTLARLLDALIAQAHSPYEVIIADGGSTDQTLEILQRYQSIFAAKDIKLVALEKKGNRSVGRNYAIDKANCEWIAVTDAGCVPHVDWLEKLADKIRDFRSENKKLQSQMKLVVAGYYDAETKSNFELAVVPYVLVMPDRVDPKHFLPATRSMLMNRSVWEKVGGFDELLNDNEDYAFAQKLKELAAIKEVVMLFARQAKVTWLPRSSLQSFLWMIFRFARGDVQAGIWRPKVIFVFGRYMSLLLVTILLAVINWQFLIIFWVIGSLFYSGWAISKNVRYAKSGWYWLPVLQVGSDLAVMLGSLAGLVTRRL